MSSGCVPCNVVPIERPRTRARVMLACMAGLVLSSGAPVVARALTITPTFNSDLSLSSIDVINHAIGFYETTFSDPVNVFIEFHNMDTGLGRSNWVFYTPTYASFRTALIGDATSSDDFTAISNANIGTGPNDPIVGRPRIDIKSANGRALGLNTPAISLGSNFCSGLVVDGCVGLNLAITDDADVGTGSFSLISTVEHEIDEVLGLASSLDTPGLLSGNILPEHLFRRAADGTRSFARNTSCVSPPAAFLSLDAGVTDLDQFNNCNNGGDYGDWITHTPQQVQDAFSNGSGAPFLTLTSPETRALDAIGFSLVTTTPEPSSIVLLATGFAGVAGGMRRRRVAPSED